MAAARILWTGLSISVIVRTLGQQEESVTPAPAIPQTKTPGPAPAYDLTFSPTSAEASEPRPSPGEGSPQTPPPEEEVPPPAEETPAPTPTLTSGSNTSASTTVEPTASVTPPTSAPVATNAPVVRPTPPPTFSYSSYCELPDGKGDTLCVDLVTEQDKQSGVGAFYDEEGCGPEAESTSVVGCAFGGVAYCRQCVFNRGLYSALILDGEEVPFVDCPCCVPDVYNMGGDIDCDFPPTPSPVEGQTSTAGTLAPGERGTGTSSASSGTEISMEPCQVGPGGTSSDILCVDVASELDWENGIGTFYESDCEGVGCSIAGYTDCRLCVFDNTAYNASGGIDDLTDCPCCVPMTYKLRPDDSDCVWPPTPSPTAAPTTYEEFLAGNGACRPGVGTAVRGSLVMFAAVIGGVLGLV